MEPYAKKYITAADIFAVEDRNTTDIEVPEWGGWVTLRVLSAAEAIDFQKSLEGTDKRSAWVRIFALCAVTPDGKSMFTKDDLTKLYQKNAAVFLRMQKTLLEFNGFKQTAEELEASKNV